MSKFDADLARTCGDEIYRNRTYTGLVSKENYTGSAYDNQDIDFGTGVRSRDGYFMEPYDLKSMKPMTLGVDDSDIYKGKIPAFGTGIGDRKINARPQFAWNGYRMPRKITPQWWNGNYTNVPGVVESTGYWDADTLGGASPSYWDKMQSVLKKQQDDEKKEKRQIIYPSGGTSGTNWNSSGSIEGFDSAGELQSSCGCGVPPTWLMIILFIVIVLIVIVMLKL